LRMHHGSMSESTNASERITEAVTSWPGVEAGIGRRGEYGFTVGGRQIGHLHGNHAAHFGFPKEVGARLREEGRVGPHPVAPDKPAWAAKRIETDQDVLDVIELLRINYDRVVARHGLPEEVGA
jgi:luciferase-like monooxygenase